VTLTTLGNIKDHIRKRILNFIDEFNQKAVLVVTTGILSVTILLTIKLLAQVPNACPCLSSNM